MKEDRQTHQPTPWSFDRHGFLYDANGRLVRISGLGTALNATSIFPKADANRAFMLRAVNEFHRRFAE